MSGEIFIETARARSFGLPVSEHLYLVFRDINGEEYVLRAGPRSSFWPFGEMEIEVNVPMEDSADDRGDDSPAERSSTPLDFPGLTDDQAWAMMVKYARSIEDADYRYDLLEENSNAFVGALLHAARGQPGEMLPTGLRADEAVGYSSWDNIVADVAPPDDWIFRGTGGNDLMAGLQIDEEFRTGAGNDVVRAGRGHDIVRAGPGDDTVIGQSGNDRLSGGSGADILRGGGGNDRLRGGSGDDVLGGGGGNDKLYGGKGNDRLNGGSGSDLLDGGPGNDRMVGGEGADRFVFDEYSGGDADTVADFEPGLDRLQFSGISNFGELTLSEGTENGIVYTELEWQTRSVRLEGTEIAELTEDVFGFV